MWLLLICSGLVFGLYCFFTTWAGGWSFGPRYLVDVVPIWFMSAGVDIENCLTTGAETRRRAWILGSFILLGCIGILNQIAGAFGANGTYAGFQWDFYGYDDDYFARFWRLDDSPLQRDYLAIYNKVRWRKAFYGRVADGVACPLGESTGAARGTVRVLENGRLRFKAFAVNLGHVPWIGVRGGAPLPPTIVYDDGTRDRNFVLDDAFVVPGAVGTFRDFSEGALTPTRTGDPVNLKGFTIGGRTQPLGCS